MADFTRGFVFIPSLGREGLTLSRDHSVQLFSIEMILEGVATGRVCYQRFYLSNFPLSVHL